MGIARSTFYHEATRDDRQLKRDLALRDEIEKNHFELPGYGYRRVHQQLLRGEKTINSKRIRRVMKKFSLFACLRKMIKQRGTRIGIHLVYPNLVRGIKLTGPNQLWSTDITYIKLVNEYVYLSAVIDVYTRKIVGWAVSRDLSHKFCSKAFDVAVKRCKPPAGIIHHSDQ